MLVVAGLMGALLYVSTRIVAHDAVELTQDRILGAATLAIAEELRSGRNGVDVDIPYSAFSMLGAMGDDRIFYRIAVDGVLVTGYEDLPLPAYPPTGLEPEFYSAAYQGEIVRVAAAKRSLLVDAGPATVIVLVAQTRSAQESIVAGLANRAALLGFGFFVTAAVLAVLLVRSVLRPVNDLAGAVTRRGPQDLRRVDRQVPVELEPMVAALNGFIDRLSGALSQAETFIAEAAHHIRTPLAALRAQAEIALSTTEDETERARLRKVVRLADDTARSASQLLDHAAVMYRTDQRSDQTQDLVRLVQGICETFRPAAELRDLEITVFSPGAPIEIRADRLLVETVIRNLLDNAIKYSGEDDSIEVHVTATDKEATVEVRDRGRGLGGSKPGDMGKRFERGSNVEDVVGSGLGLAISGEVAAVYGGKLDLVERSGGGACARFSIPL
ncbi:MAG: sensor histidine kinase [Marinibacterium sp.]